MLVTACILHINNRTIVFFCTGQHHRERGHLHLGQPEARYAQTRPTVRGEDLRNGQELGHLPGSEV